MYFKNNCLRKKNFVYFYLNSFFGVTATCTFTKVHFVLLAVLDTGYETLDMSPASVEAPTAAAAATTTPDEPATTPGKRTSFNPNASDSNRDTEALVEERETDDEDD